MTSVDEIAGRYADKLNCAPEQCNEDIDFLLAEVKRLEVARDAAYLVIRHMELCASDRMHALHRTVFEAARKMGDE